MADRYSDTNGNSVDFDLDGVIRVIDGWSARVPGWQSLIVYEPRNRVFLELASADPDVRGNAAEEVVQVNDGYVMQFGLTQQDMELIRSRPEQWQFLRARSQNA